MVVLSEIPPSIIYVWNSNTLPTTPTYYIPCGTKELYATESGWKDLTIQELPTYTVTLLSSNERMGEAVMTTSNTCTNDNAVITAYPRQGCRFVQWTDGNTNNPRTIQVVDDVTYTAEFEALHTYQLSSLYDIQSGYVTGTGTYFEGEEATLTATPADGHRFIKWSDGLTDNPRTVIVTSDTTLNALFVRGEYCGDDILWTLENSTLALRGTGEMYNWNSFGWHNHNTQIDTLLLTDGITSIGTNAFMDLMFVTSARIPASVTTIGMRAFENCRSMDSVIFAANSQLRKIDHWAFFQCLSLRDINLPEGVTTIGNGAFYGCAYLENLTLPSSVETIADNGFALCSKLKSMTVNAPEPPAVESKTFEDVERSIPVYVPVGSAPKYKAAAVWKEFNIQSEGEPTGVENTLSADNDTTPAAQKIVRDGQVLILRGGKTYTVTGVEVK